MKKQALFVIGLFVFGVIFAKSSPFLVQIHKSSRVSKNELKENVGEELKNALHHSAIIMCELGRVQQELADFQRRLLSRVESLVENVGEFKKGNRVELSEAKNIMDKVNEELGSQKQNIRELVVRMEKNKCLRRG